jgi:hypothetical protein
MTNLLLYPEDETKLGGFSPQTNYTDRTTHPEDRGSKFLRNVDKINRLSGITSQKTITFSEMG